MRRAALHGRGLAGRASERLNIYRELCDEFAEYNPLAVWPEPRGFLPFADSIDGDSLSWLTDGEPVVPEFPQLDPLDDPSEFAEFES